MHNNEKASILDFTRLKAANETVADINATPDIAVNAHNESSDNSSEQKQNDFHYLLSVYNIT